ncbi:hypothetical protein, partial [Streptomyces longisporus]|uniref:hypothetical protein n=1 Tax=Streptomyces longisporus TaxID=1948 RepID=UPI0031DCE410
GPPMTASWTSKTPGRLIGIVEDTGDLLPDGQVIAPHRPTDATGGDNLFVAYMEAFEASNKHWAACQACQEDRPCAVGGPIHDRFAQLQDRYEATKKSGLATT